jgi:type II secretory pathway pseudopilin PulG
MLLGLGWPQWLTIIGLVGGLVLTFWVMAKASASYERARLAREARSNAAQGSAPDGAKTREEES